MLVHKLLYVTYNDMCVTNFRNLEMVQVHLQGEFMIHMSDMCVFAISCIHSASQSQKRREHAHVSN